ncbi:hypothetical protein C8R44DRAFT_988592 [Mycena epipterygia]|nr:hypothetical protein C8R44DRAFT_988592 [Mycena epipterygia]
METPPVDLKQVGQLFNVAIASIRDDTPTLEALEPQAIAWLKEARYKLMCKIEQSYYQLERSRNSVALRPSWVDPSRSLIISTANIPTVLLPFTTIFCGNLSNLMKDCGFNCDAFGSSSDILVAIQFPTPQRVAADSRPIVPQTLLVEDQFSRIPAGAEEGGTRRIGAFFAADFGRLLVDARGETPGEVEEPQSAEIETAKERHSSSRKDEGLTGSQSQLNIDGLNNIPLLLAGWVAVVWAVLLVQFLF